MSETSCEEPSADDLAAKRQRCLYIEHGSLCLRDGTGWLLWSAKLADIGQNDIVPMLPSNESFGNSEPLNLAQCAEAVLDCLLSYAATEMPMQQAMERALRTLEESLKDDPLEPTVTVADAIARMAPEQRLDAMHKALEPARRDIEWIIIGGESTQGGGKARPFDLAWARSVLTQGCNAGVPVFMKQLGSNPVDGAERIKLHDRAGADPSEWDDELRVQEFPE